jgi:hypothetical protein
VLKRAADSIRGLGHGTGLSAIFLHNTTHKNSDGTAVHQSGIADELKRRMQARVDLTETERVPIKKGLKDKLAVNPRDVNFKPFLAECKRLAEERLKAKPAAEKASAEQAIKQAEDQEKEVVKKGEDAAHTDAKQVLKEQIKIAFDSALAQTSTAVATSLSLSFVDGDRSTHGGAIADLRQKAQTSWKPILDAAN